MPSAPTGSASKGNNFAGCRTTAAALRPGNNINTKVARSNWRPGGGRQRTNLCHAGRRRSSRGWRVSFSFLLCGCVWLPSSRRRCRAVWSSLSWSLLVFLVLLLIQPQTSKDRDAIAQLDWWQQLVYFALRIHRCCRFHSEAIVLATWRQKFQSRPWNAPRDFPSSTNLGPLSSYWIRWLRSMSSSHACVVLTFVERAHFWKTVSGQDVLGARRWGSGLRPGTLPNLLHVGIAGSLPTAGAPTPCAMSRSTSGCPNLNGVFSFLFSFGWRFVC